MKTKTSLVAIAVALSLTAGCANRRTPDQIPPEAANTTDDNLGVDPDGADSSSAAQGTRGDFLQSVGQFGDRILFDFDSYTLDAEDRATLDAQAQWLARYPAVRVTIEGHADERGTREYNLALGDRRANAARVYLESRGVASGRMQVISWGKERPADPQSNEDAWRQNRRSVTVVPE